MNRSEPVIMTISGFDPLGRSRCNCGSMESEMVLNPAASISR